MAGRDGLVEIHAYIPEPLLAILKRYQSGRYLGSFNAALIEILETHPRMVALVTEVMYAANSQQDNPERTPA